MRETKVIENKVFQGEEIVLNGIGEYFYKSCIFINCKIKGSDNLTNFHQCEFYESHIDPVIKRRVLENGWDNVYTKSKLKTLYKRINIFIRNLVD